MDVALLTPFALAIMGWARYWPPAVFALWLLLIMLLAFNLARLMTALMLSPERQQIVMALGLATAVFLSIHGLLHDQSSLLDTGWLGQFFRNINEHGNMLWQRELGLFLLVVLMWARGIQMANRTATIARIGLRLRVGGLLIAPFVIWLGSRSLLWNATPFVLLFFLAGLTAVALTRAEEIAKDETGYSASLSPRWLFLIFLVSLVIVTIGGFIAIVISGDSAEVAAGFFSPLWLALGATLVSAIATIGYLITPLVLAVQWLVGVVTAVWAWFAMWFYLLAKIISKLFPTRWDTRPIDTQTITPGVEQIEQFTNPDSTFAIGWQAIFFLLAVAVILIVALFLQQAYQRTAVAVRVSGNSREYAEETSDEEGLLQKLLGRLGFVRGWHTAVSIRRIYRQMMALADAGGYPKLDVETPYEYLATLDKAWPQNRPESRIITNAYVKVRYGEIPETANELAEIKQAWDRLQKAQVAETVSE
jgi:hypothetical protein